MLQNRNSSGINTTENGKTVEVPREIFERLLESGYFEEACKRCGIEKWNMYDNVLLCQKQLAVSNIMEENKE